MVQKLEPEKFPPKQCKGVDKIPTSSSSCSLEGKMQSEQRTPVGQNFLVYVKTVEDNSTPNRSK